MKRVDKVLSALNPQGLGLEIGPCHNAVAPKHQGFNVDIVDHLSQEGLVEKYGDHSSVDVSKIEPVDFVWEGGSYADLTGKRNYYDWVIASHVVEHVPDLVQFINSCDEVLKDDGVLSLVIPDKRFCFDRFRAISSLDKAIDSHHQALDAPSAGSVLEAQLNSVTLGGRIDWEPGYEGSYDFISDVEASAGFINKRLVDGEYVDVHQWCFVPSSLRLMLADLQALGLISLRETSFQPTSGCEFFITLSRSGKGPDLSRPELLFAVDDEQKNLLANTDTKRRRFMGLRRTVRKWAKAILRRSVVA